MVLRLHLIKIRVTWIRGSQIPATEAGGDANERSRSDKTRVGDEQQRNCGLKNTTRALSKDTRHQ